MPTTHQRLTPGRPHSRARAALLVIGTSLAVAAVLAACSAQPSLGTASGAKASPAAAGGKAAGDWAHALQVVANLQADPPDKPVVLLFGGSAARESTVSDASWRAQIEDEGGPATAAYNLGSRNRTAAQTLALVQALPKVPTIIYLGVNLGAFTSAQKTAKITLPDPVTPLPAYQQHQYSESHILSTAQKQAAVQNWLTKRYPVFKANLPTSAAVLERIIKVCKVRHLRPVLFDLPRDTAVIGGQLDAPIARYRKACQALAKKYDIPYVSLVSRAKLPNGDFYDLWHLVEPGRTVWQQLLSKETAALLREYGYGDGSGS